MDLYNGNNNRIGDNGNNVDNGANGINEDKLNEGN